MRMSDCLIGGYFGTSDVRPGEELVLTIAGCKMETMPRSVEKKPVLSFRETSKKLVLDSARLTELVAAIGDDTGMWQGQRIVLYGGLFEGKFLGRWTDFVGVK